MNTLTQFYAIDLEMEQPSNEIISIGIAWNAISHISGELETYAKDFLITPSQPVSEFIQNLTGLKDDMYDWSKSRLDCFKEFTNFFYELGDLHKEAIVWGCGDIPTLRDQLLGLGLPHVGSRRFIDVKTLVFMNNAYAGKSLSTRVSLGSALHRYKIKQYGTAHNSAADAYNTLALFNQLVIDGTKMQKALTEISYLVGK